MTTHLSVAKRRLCIVLHVAVTAGLFSYIFISMKLFTDNFVHKLYSLNSSTVKSDTMATNHPYKQFIAVMDVLHRQRVVNLENTCRQSKLFNKRRESAINQASIYFEPYKAAICDIQKCGSSSWQKAVLVAEGYYSENDYKNSKIRGQKVFDLLDAKRFKSMNSSDVKKTWLQSTKIIMVRNPFARLVSAYFSKLHSNGRGFSNFYRRVSTTINQQYRSIRSNFTDRLGNDTAATFEDFVNFLLNTNPKYYDYHWALYETVCDPCRYTHDIVVKFETLVYDVDYMRHRLNLSEKDARIFFPNVTDHLDDIKVQETFSSVPIASVYRLYKIYQRDFDRFGYEMPKWLSNLNSA